MISRLLVANRAEIASRVFATCRRLGIRTVAVHSPADAGLAFVAEADLAVELPGNAPADSYLRIDAILDAARSTRADAVHPGYGFLAENADFARAVIDAGLTWVGPTPASIEAMGDKVRAKALMRSAGVPVLESLDPAAIAEADLPVLIKASAGGGGRGMRVVRSLADLPGEIEAARAEALSAFGDGTVFVEPYVERGRHVEVQVVDTSVFGERDCSLQRRHQKVLEESPAPGLRDEVRAAIHQAARSAAEAVDYRGAGTVEFLYDPETERFFFLEMNTRLQVEHPVTELVYGVDLVRLQLASAEGDWLMSWPDEPGSHAVEVRVYAEDPASSYQPQTGRLVTFDIPHEAAFGPLDRQGVRVDAGFRSGDEVSPHYDAMLAKVISWAPSREQAIRQLAGALRRARIHGVTTNRDQLLAILADERFRAGEVSTALLDEISLPAPGTDPVVLMAAATTHLADVAAGRRTQRGIAPGWRNVTSQLHRVRLEVGGEQHEVGWRGWPPEFPELDGRATAAADGHGWRVAVTHDGRTEHSSGLIAPAPPGRPRRVFVDTPDRSTAVLVIPRFTDPAAQHATGSLLAPMPGTVVSVVAATGERSRPASRCWSSRR
ncbi:acetyl/propionyl/methylcrotonyl-CoA carboxylase subunit alpha [Nocardioides sp.]|uniref:acetyl-CoA carboxylase biotin carboxylase subunit n=1 Tax=Nocardioides sp. TaxID=35761 RepID=UPI003528EB85